MVFLSFWEKELQLSEVEGILQFYTRCWELVISERRAWSDVLGWFLMALPWGSTEEGEEACCISRLLICQLVVVRLSDGFLADRRLEEEVLLGILQQGTAV